MWLLFSAVMLKIQKAEFLSMKRKTFERCNIAETGTLAKSGWCVFDFCWVVLEWNSGILRHKDQKIAPFFAPLQKQQFALPGIKRNMVGIEYFLPEVRFCSVFFVFYMSFHWSKNRFWSRNMHLRKEKKPSWMVFLSQLLGGDFNVITSICCGWRET